MFLVRKGNPKQIRDWDDLDPAGHQGDHPEAENLRRGALDYLAAWGYALRQPGGNEANARAFVAALYRNVPVLDSGARGATITFTQRRQGDVLIAWENEAFLALEEFGRDTQRDRGASAGDCAVIVEIRGLSRSFGGDNALVAIDLTVAEGEFLALLGPSGAGETTLLRIIASLVQSDSGVVAIGGRDVRSLWPRGRQIGFVFQNYALFRHMTGRATLRSV